MEALEDRRLLAFNVPVLNFPGFHQADVNFDPNSDFIADPPDTVGDVGVNYYIQAVNTATGSAFNIYNKSDGSLAQGPIFMERLSLTPACSFGEGDPIVMYDEMAGRWLLSEFTSTGNNGGLGNALCVYVSQTSDPTNNLWHAYEFQTGGAFPDYPHYAVTPDAYVVTTNEQQGIPNPAVYAMDRASMLQGLPARPFMKFSAPWLSGFGFQALTAADVDGPTPPPAGSPTYLMRHVDEERHFSPVADPRNDYLEIWELKTDFSRPAASSFVLSERIAVPDFDSDLCDEDFDCIPQPGTNIGLDAISQVIMHRLQYRNFSTHETIVGNFTVDVNGNDQAGIRWFEMRKDPNNPFDRWKLHQQGVHAPDGDNRWLGSIAMNGNGDIALGYNIASSATNPGIRYTGRRAADPRGIMTQGDIVGIHGRGFLDTDDNRWGDYSSMSVDPVDDNTFWFTSEYANNTLWGTQIMAFRFDPLPDPPAPPPAPGTTVTGVKFNDLNGNGRRETEEDDDAGIGEPGIEGVGIYIDYDDDGRPDLGEPLVRTDKEGNYTLTLDRGDGVYVIREEQQPGWTQTRPGPNQCPIRDPGPTCGYTITVTGGVPNPRTGLDFGNQATSDFGDAPASYGTFFSDGGAFAPIMPGFHLGANVDGEGDGIPSDTADGDDLDLAINDEDGVTFNNPLFPGASTTVSVSVTAAGFSPGRVNGWIDFNRDGDWNDPGEHAVHDVRLGHGSHAVSLAVPADAVPGLTYARFTYGYRRFGLGEAPLGGDTSGEVEDYQVRVLALTPTANADQFQVRQNSTANSFDVLANDLPSRDAPLQILSVGQPDRGGTVLVAPGGGSIRYTPASGFSGREQFTYTIRDQADNTDTALVTVNVTATSVNPIAVDNSYRLLTNSSNNALQILDNDLSGESGPIGIVAFTLPRNGFVTLDDRGTGDSTDDQFLYTPVAEFAGIDTFMYTIEDTRGVQSTATVTLHVESGAGDDNTVNFSVATTNLNGEPISVVSVGGQFQVRVSVQDLRTSDPDSQTPGDQRGVFAAYMDLLYDSTLVSTITDSQNSRGFMVEFGPAYGNFASGNNDTPSVIDEIGAIQLSDATGNIPPLGPEPVLLFTLTLDAVAEGSASFITDPADISPLHDTLLFEPPAAVSPTDIGFGAASITIGGSAEGEAETNSANSHDVNNDGAVSPIDALLVINRLNTGRPPANGAAEGEDRRLYYDVDGDDFISPRDALLVINYLNQLVVGGEGESDSSSLQSHSFSHSALVGGSFQPFSTSPRTSTGNSNNSRIAPSVDSFDARVYQQHSDHNRVFAHWFVDPEGRREKVVSKNGLDGELLDVIVEDISQHLP